MTTNKTAAQPEPTTDVEDPDQGLLAPYRSLPPFITVQEAAIILA